MKRKTFCSDSGIKSAYTAENKMHRKGGGRPFAHMLSAILLLSLFLSGCMATKADYQQSQQQTQQFIDKHTAGAVNAETFDGQALASRPIDIPTRFQNPSFLLNEMESTIGFEDEISIPIGADISSNTGPVALREIMKRLAVLKGMNVSWESDVDQGALVDVDIRAEDDFFESIDNLLRQLDYFHEVDGNSIVVKYRKSKVYHLALPHMTPTYEISVGGNVLGGGEGGEYAGDLEGTIQLKSKGRDDQVFDVWKNIENNLTKILSLYEETSRRDTIILTDSDTDTKEEQGESEEGYTQTKSTESTTELARTKSKGALGQVTYDRPLGIITVTAPRGVLERTDSYFENLKRELYRQVTIEAKIVEVELTEDNRTGINWDDLLDSAFNFNLDFQKLNPYLIVNESATEEKHFLTVDDKSFTLLLDLIEDQGHTELLANPKITVMNGQPALINVGESIQYVSEIIQTATDTIVTVTPTTSQVFSGLGLGVIANIIDDEVILNLTPIESEVVDWNTENIGGNTLTLPTVAVREMNTQVRVKSGEMLVIGGLISSIRNYEESGIKGLRKLAFGSKMFKRNGVDSRKRELVIMLRPVIQNFGNDI